MDYIGISLLEFVLLNHLIFINLFIEIYSGRSRSFDAQDW